MYNTLKDLIEAYKKGYKALALGIIKSSEFVVNQKWENDITPLHIAVYYADVKAVGALIKKGADKEAKEKIGSTPLHIAAYHGKTEIIKILLDYGAKIDSVQSEGGSPLCFAAQNGQVDSVKLLVEKGANINQQDVLKRTPLLIATLREKTDVFKALLELGANPSIADVDGNTPLHFAACFGKIEIIKILLDYGAKIDSVQSEGGSPLCFAAQNGQVDSIKLLVEKGANINQQDVYKRTPILIAAYKKKIDVVKALLELGANPDIADYKGQTPLSYFAKKEIIVGVKLLVESGVNVDIDTARYTGAIQLIVKTARALDKIISNQELDAVDLAVLRDSVAIENIVDVLLKRTESISNKTGDIPFKLESECSRYVDILKQVVFVIKAKFGENHIFKAFNNEIESLESANRIPDTDPTDSSEGLGGAAFSVYTSVVHSFEGGAASSHTTEVVVAGASTETGDPTSPS